MKTLFWNKQTLDIVYVKDTIEEIAVLAIEQGSEKAKSILIDNIKYQLNFEVSIINNNPTSIELKLTKRLHNSTILTNRVIVKVCWRKFTNGDWDTKVYLGI